MLISTPNLASIASVASLLEGRDNPQIFSIYTRPQPGEEPDIPHVREYTADELGRTVQAAGFKWRCSSLRTSRNTITTATSWASSRRTASTSGCAASKPTVWVSNVARCR